ncbi:MAG TPA: hypothetical protein G4N96_00105 [Chloroflexi bacterium]|nr:hypothetical protein [Chloroflexota bacterium]
MSHHWKTWSRLALGIAVLSVLLLGISGGTAQAADFRGGDFITIDADEVIDDDLFISGQRVEMNGIVKGDLIASGSEVIINGKVKGSLVVAGQMVEVNGPVGGSMYGAGYSVTVGPKAEIGRNVYGVGYSVKTEAGSSIGRSLYAGGYQVLLNGDVANDVETDSAALALNGAVGGDVKSQVSVSGEAAPPGVFMPGMPIVESAAPGLQVGDNAKISGTLDVTEMVEEGAGGTATEGQSIVVTAGKAILARAGEFIALMIVGGLLLQFWPAMVKRAGELLQTQPLPSAGWGCAVTLIFVVAVPIVAVLLFIVASLGGIITAGQLFGDILGIGGASLALVVSLFTFVLSVVTKALVAFLAGRLILAKLAPQMEPGTGQNLGALALGAFIYEILRVIPFLGWVIAVIVVLLGLGALYYFAQEMLRPNAPPEDSAAPEVVA